MEMMSLIISVSKPQHPSHAVNMQVDRGMKTIVELCLAAED